MRARVAWKPRRATREVEVEARSAVRESIWHLSARQTAGRAIGIHLCGLGGVWGYEAAEMVQPGQDLEDGGGAQPSAKRRSGTRIQR
jgi:hypothetical protein